MLSVKIEFCPLDNIQAVQQKLFYTTEYICVECFQAIAKSSKKENTMYMK